MLGFLWGNKAFINEKTLEQNKVKIIHKSDLKIDKTSCMAITGSGKFFKGTLRNEAVTIKVYNLIILFFL